MDADQIRGFTVLRSSLTCLLGRHGPDEGQHAARLAQDLIVSADQGGRAFGHLLEGFGLSPVIAFSRDLKPVGHRDPL